MFKIELELPESVSFVRSGHEMTFDLLGLSATILADLVEHGLTQKVGDAAAGKTGDEAKAKMQMTYDALRAGNWGVRKAAGPRKTKDELEPYFETVMEKNFRQLVGMQLAYPKGSKKAERIAFLRDAYDSLSETRRAVVDAKVEKLWLEENQELDLGDEEPKV